MIIRQRGQMLVYALVALAVVTICGGALYAYNKAIKENAVLRGSLATTEQALSEQVTENYLQRERQRHTDQLLAKRQGAREVSADLERKIDASLEKAYRDSPQARAWRDQPVPADVLRGVRNESDRADRKDKPGIPTAKPAGSPSGR